MSKIEINTDDILPTIGKIAIGLVILLIVAGMAIVVYNNVQSETTTQDKLNQLQTGLQQIQQNQLQPTQTPVPVVQYPSSLQFTVLSQSIVAGGQYQVETTDGQFLHITNQNTYYSMIPQATYYTNNIAGVDSFGYIVGNVQLIHEPYDIYVVGDDYPRYYHDENGYWQYDGRTTDKISWKEARGEHVINSHPPHY